MSSLVGTALVSGRSILEPAGIGSLGLEGSYTQLLTEVSPVVPSYHYQKLVTQTHYTSVKFYSFSLLHPYLDLTLFVLLICSILFSKV